MRSRYHRPATVEIDPPISEDLVADPFDAEHLSGLALLDTLTPT